MDCKTFESLIPDFIGRKMDYLTLKAFRKHMRECKKCKEELTIKFLIDEGLVRLEEGDAFDLSLEMRNRIEEAEKKIHRHDFYIRVGAVFEYIVMIGAMTAVALIIFWGARGV